MITRILYAEEQELFNKVAAHPLQTWEWGDFAQAQGKTVVRLGVFEGTSIKQSFQLIFSTIPKTNFSVGFYPRGPELTPAILDQITTVGKKENALFVRLEPQQILRTWLADGSEKLVGQHPTFPSLVLAPRHTFAPFTSILDLGKTEEELLANLHPKTRYNISVAKKYGVEIFEDTSDQGLASYLDLTFALTKRKGFFLHDRAYHEKLWQTLKTTGMLHLLFARYQGELLASYMLFGLGDTWYYPYGASSPNHKEVMASNLLMWETILLGKKLGFKRFDMWGTLGPDPNPRDPWFGFHRFKLGYGGDLVQFVGSWDLVINEPLYRLYTIADNLRWKALTIRKKLHI